MPQAPFQAVLSDNFEGDAAGSSPTGWTSTALNSSWTVQKQNANQVLSHSGWSGYLSAGNSGWTQYLLSVSVEPSGWASEQDGLVFAHSEAGHYSVDIVGGNQLVLTSSVGGTDHTLAQAAYSFNPWRWYTLSVSFTQGSITAYVDGKAVLHSTDSILSAGAIGLEANDPVVFDNVVVSAAGVPSQPSSTPRP